MCCWRKRRRGCVFIQLFISAPSCCSGEHRAAGPASEHTDLSAFVIRNLKHASPAQRVIHGFPLTSPVLGRSEMQRWCEDFSWLYFVYTHQVDTVFLSILRLGLNFAKEATLESPKLMLYRERRSPFSSYQEEFDFEMFHGFGEFLKVTGQNLRVCHGDVPHGLTLLLGIPTKGRQDWILP